MKVSGGVSPTWARISATRASRSASERTPWIQRGSAMVSNTVNRGFRDS